MGQAYPFNSPSCDDEVFRFHLYDPNCADHGISGARPAGYRASVLLAPGLGGPELPLVLFLLCGFSLFGILLPTLFGLVLLAFLVAHR